MLRRGYVLALGAWTVSCTWAQFSPGPLSKAHRSLEGPTRCTACHAVGTGARAFKCLSCHTEIRTRLAERRGFHATLSLTVRNQQECIRCHSEHNGERFVPIRWHVDLSEFDHRKTGYALEGRHRGLECRQCHAPRRISAVERRGIIVRDLGRTYLGLSRECLSCHADEHRGQLSAGCAKCHTFSAWKAAPGFDHGAARFQLAGAHRTVECAKCHPRAGDGMQWTQFAGLAFAGCTPCHQDPHRGAFAISCSACHSDDAWRPARMSEQFDHLRTEFPLAGKHIGVTCGRCHRTADFAQPVAHTRCLDCHADSHQGQFAARASGGECGACHTVDGWKPTTFTLASHQQTQYPLGGRHALVACEKCHAPAGNQTRYKIRFERCRDCHADSHRAEFSGPPHEERCQQCHTVNGWRPSTFTLARHAKSRWPLAGAHAAIACADCHHSQANGQPAAGRFRFSDLSCAGCHADPHGGQFTRRVIAQRPGAADAGCGSCHNLRRWRDVAKFDHSATMFPLAGAHRAVECRSCHRLQDSGGSIRNVVFRSAARECAACHEDIHGGQFAGARGGADCSRCHDVLKWKPSLFRHDRDSEFALAGAHRGVACALCHTATRNAGTRLVLVYKPTPKECSSCHGPDTAG